MWQKIGRVLIASGSREGFLRNRALSEKIGPEISGWVRDGNEALRRSADMPVDVVLTDMALPVLDGAALAERMSTANMAVHPGVIVIRRGAIPEVLVRRIHAAGGCVTEDSADMFAAALEAVRPENRESPKEIAEKCAVLLNRLGVPEHDGRRYLEYAILLAHRDRRLADSLTGTLYPTVGKKFAVTARQAERAMRHVIEKAWQSGAADEQYALFRGTIDEERGKPTCGEAIALLADILRLEG